MYLKKITNLQTKGFSYLVWCPFFDGSGCTGVAVRTAARSSVRTQFGFALKAGGSLIPAAPSG